jgi:hypothetical protein
MQVVIRSNLSVHGCRTQEAIERRRLYKRDSQSRLESENEPVGSTGRRDAAILDAVCSNVKSAARISATFFRAAQRIHRMRPKNTALAALAARTSRNVSGSGTNPVPKPAETAAAVAPKRARQAA